ncbi:MAG: alpha/beta fold hydrolase [Candidatus Acidiferrales bacterium]
MIFGTSDSPEALSSVSSPFAAMDFSALPAIERYRSRDGAALFCRTYGGGEGQVAVLLHGCAGSSSDMHALAPALQHAGARVYVPDLRGHGASSPRGDIASVGELDDDMADFIRDAQSKHPRREMDPHWNFIESADGLGEQSHHAAIKNHEWNYVACRRRAQSRAAIAPPCNDSIVRSSAPRKAQTVSLVS